ncbi:unnamed protein product [Closterium sp. Yama58-4]|nr:unnamed protein product [Closterium sp. Yama58-4]
MYLMLKLWAIDTSGVFVRAMRECLYDDVGGYDGGGGCHVDCGYDGGGYDGGGGNGGGGYGGGGYDGGGYDGSGYDGVRI